MTLTLQLLLILLIAGGIGNTLADDGPKKNIQNLQALQGRFEKPPVPNSLPPLSLSVPQHNNRVCCDTQALPVNLLMAYINPSLMTTGALAALLKPVEERYREIRNKSGLRYTTGSGPDRTGSNFDESNENSAISNPGPRSQNHLENFGTFGETSNEKYRSRVRRSENRHRPGSEKHVHSREISSEEDSYSGSDESRPHVYGVSGSTIHIYYNRGSGSREDSHSSSHRGGRKHGRR